MRHTEEVFNDSCIGCKYLYSIGLGYSNYTLLDTEIRCAKNKNKYLPAHEPCDWVFDGVTDNWEKTNSGRCELYAAGVMVKLDVDGEDGPADYIDDKDVIESICNDSGRSRKGNIGEVFE